MMELGPFKRRPYKHQLEALRLSAEEEYFALLMEQRCGKSPVVLDTAAHAYRADRINALLIIAPNGVHRAWVTDEIPLSLPDDTNYRCFIWRSAKAGLVSTNRELAEWFTHPGLKVMSVNIDAILTTACQEMLKRLLIKYRVMSVVDESSDISNTSAKRTKVAHRIGRRSVMRRILDGTPVAQGPLGLYSQFEFLQPGALGFTSFYSFKARYAILKRRTLANGNSFDEITGYRNLEELQTRMRAHSYRITRAECHDLPPKVYEKRYVTLAPAQRKAYDEMRRHAITELAGQVLTAPLVLTRYLRLQQIASNIVPVTADLVPCPVCPAEAPDDECPECHGYGFVVGVRSAETLRIVPMTEDPRLLELERIVDGLSDQQGVIWARFRPDLDGIASWCQRRGITYARYDGSTDAEEREAGKAAFMRGERQLFIGNARAGGRGLDLSAATWVCYYSHDWGLRTRLQSEDRVQSLKRKDAVLYLDVIVEDSVDSRIVEALRAGKQISDLITGDKVEEFL